MIKKIFFPPVLTLATLGVGVLAQSADAFTLFTDRTAWEAEIAGATITTDPFDNNIAQGQSITLDSGIISTNSDPVDYSDNRVRVGVYDNATDGDGGEASRSVTWDFPEPIYAFATDFIDVNMGGRLTLTGNFDGTGDVTLTVADEIGDQDGFLGIVGEANFASIVFGNNTNSNDVFNIDNASFATQSESVPEPSNIIAVAMLGSGFLLTRRGKKN